MSEEEKKPESETELRQKLMATAVKLIDGLDKLDEEAQVLVFEKVVKWYAVATKGQSIEDEGEAFHGFRKRAQGRGGAGSDPGGDGVVPPKDYSALGRARPSAKAHRRRTNGYQVRDTIVPSK